MRPSLFDRRVSPMPSGLLRASIFAIGVATVAVVPGASARAAEAETVPMDFSIVAAGTDCPGCVVVNARGEFVDKTSRDFALFIAEARMKGILPKEQKGQAIRAPGPRVIVAFESIGGKVVPALVIGRRIRQLGWTTVVGHATHRKAGTTFESAGCYSACSMVMLGGVQRYVVPGSKLGVHQFAPQFGEDETFTAADVNQIIRDYGRQVVGVHDYVKEMGVDLAFFVATMRTPFTSMDVLAPERWTSIGIATGVLPDTGDLSVAAVLDAGGGSSATMSPAEEQVRPEPAKPLEPALSASADPASQGVWTIATAGTARSAYFADAAIRVSLACLKGNAAKLDVTFKDLDPVDLEHIRAAAFASRRLQFAEREIAIDSVGAPGRGEQSLAVVLDIRDLRALQTASNVTFSVLDRAGRPAGQSASITALGAARAIEDVMSSCGGV